MDILHKINLEKSKPNSITHRQLRTMYNDYPFDMNLVASNGGKVPVHHFVLMMFSPYVRKMFITKQLNFVHGMDVSFKEFSHEVLMDAVKMFYLSETAVRTEMLVQFHALLQHFSFASTSHGIVKFNRPSEDNDDDVSGWQVSNCKGCKADLKKLVREKLFYGCSMPECKYEFGIKLVNGQLMRKILQPDHSAECNENNVTHEASIEAVVLENDNKRASRKRVIDLMKFAEKNDDGTSESSSDDDIPKKQSKKQDTLPSNESIVAAESEAAESELNSDIEVIIADPNAEIDG